MASPSLHYYLYRQKQAPAFPPARRKGAGILRYPQSSIFHQHQTGNTKSLWPLIQQGHLFFSNQIHPLPFLCPCLDHSATTTAKATVPL